MITSMTGFGTGEVKEGNRIATVEIRTVNSRFCEISIRSPKVFNHKEQVLKDLIRKKISRGRISVSVTVDSSNNDKQNRLKIDEELAGKYHEILERLRTLTWIKEKIQLSDLLKFSDIITYEEEPAPDDKFWDMTENATNIALDNVLEMRRIEGENTARDIKARLKNIEDNRKHIEKISEGRKQREFEKLRGRIAKLIDRSSVNDERLEQEIAILADKLEISEELVRFSSHNKLFLSFLQKNEPVGQKLNFLLQEMNREVNTISAKSNHAEISQIVVSLKSELEKIREQVQNIE